MKHTTLALCFLLASCTSVFYQQDRINYWQQGKLPASVKELTLTTSAGVELHGVHYKSKKRATHLLVAFHGNAQNLSSHFQGLMWMGKYPMDLLMIDYPGYGKSGSKPTPSGMRSACQEILAYAQKLKGSKKLVALGQSLGGNLMIRALKDSGIKPDYLVLDSTFLNYRSMAFSVMTSMLITLPFSPLAYVLFADGPSAATGKLALSPKRIAIIHSPQDPVVPFSQGVQVAEHLGLDEKSIWIPQKPGHIQSLFNSKTATARKLMRFLKLKP